MYFSRLFIIFSILSILNTLLNAEFIVVVAKHSKLEKLSKKDIEKIFLSKMKSLPNGNKALPIELNNKEFQTIFYKTIANKNRKQLSKYWAKMIFTGKGIPPKKFKKINDIKEFLHQNHNAISYLRKDSFDNNLKIVWEY